MIRLVGLTIKTILIRLCGGYFLQKNECGRQNSKTIPKIPLHLVHSPCMYILLSLNMSRACEYDRVVLLGSGYHTEQLQGFNENIFK